VVDTLAAHHGEFQKYSGGDDEGPEDAAQRKLHRRGRQEASLKTNVLLAEMGEVQMVDELQRLPFEGRLLRLKGFLESLAEAADPVSTEAPSLPNGVTRHG